MAYLILELDTGLMDGWYSYDCSEVLEYWDEVRPGHRHIIVESNATQYFPDHMCLNRQPNRGVENAMWQREEGTEG